jgi:hypothetical protein
MATDPPYGVSYVQSKDDNRDEKNDKKDRWRACAPV